MSSPDLSPKVWITCAKSGRADLWFTLSREPDQPPPLRGVYATVRLDEGKPTIFEMSWVPPRSWTVRHESKPVSSLFARQFASARVITIDGFTGADDRGARWQIDLPDADRRRFAAACG